MLKAREGSLAEVPFALLLRALAAEEQTCTLELKLRNLEKVVSFEAGQLIGCESNLLHESLGKYLVEKGKLTEAQHHAVLGESAATGRAFATVLVEQKLLSPYELFKHLQTNLAHRILDVFRWSDARWRLGPTEDVETPIRMNTARLVYMGASAMADEAVAKHFPLPGAQRLAMCPDGPDPRTELKLAGRDLKLWQALKVRPTLDELQRTAGFSPAEVNRRLLAWTVLGMMDLAERVDASPRPSPPSTPVPPAQVLGLPYLDEDEAVLNALASDVLTFRGKDPFDLLQVPVSVEGPALQRAYLAKSERFPPCRFKGSEARAKAEQLQLAYARAFGALADHESNQLHRKRRETAEAMKKQGGPKPDRAAAHFRIRTDLLDANTQFTQGLDRFTKGDYAGAAEQFEYACDIEPRGRFRAFLAAARYRLHPEFSWVRTLEELAQVCEAEPDCLDAWGFRGEIALAWGRKPEAKEAFERGLKLKPGDTRFLKGLAASR